MQSLTPFLSFILLIAVIWVIVRWRKSARYLSQVSTQKFTPKAVELAHEQKPESSLAYKPKTQIISAKVGDVDIDLNVSDKEIEPLLQEWSFVFEEDRPNQLKGDEPWYKKRNQTKYRKSDPDRALDWALPFIPKSVAENEQLRPLVEIGLEQPTLLYQQVRKIIAERQVAGTPITDLVRAEYGLRVLFAFLDALNCPSNRYFRFGIPQDFVALRDLLIRPVDYQQIGYEHLRFSTKVKEKKLLVDTLGEPEQHTPVEVFYADVIRQTRSRMLWKRLQSSLNLKGGEDDLKVKMKSWLSEQLRSQAISNRTFTEDDRQREERSRLWHVEAEKRIVNYPGYKPMSLYRERVVGVTQENADGSSRQDLIARLKEKDAVELIRDPGNSHDPNAIMVCNDKGKQIGFIDSNRASELAPQMDNGYKVEAWVDRVMGGDSDKSFGVLITIQRYKPVPESK